MSTGRLQSRQSGKQEDGSFKPSQGNWVTRENITQNSKRKKCWGCNSVGKPQVRAHYLLEQCLLESENFYKDIATTKRGRNLILRIIFVGDAQMSSK